MATLKPELTFTSNSIADTYAIAEDLVAGFDQKGDYLLLLEGDFGSGKTEFVKGLAQALGVIEPKKVNSPSFVLVQAYPFEHLRLGTGELVHIDLWRLEQPTDLVSIGVKPGQDYDSQNKSRSTSKVIAVEWPTKLIQPAQYEFNRVVRLTIKSSVKSRYITIDNSTKFV